MVILVDKYDRPRGTAPKMEAHRQGLLHRAFSVFIFDSRGRLLIQRRAPDKYHSPGLWANTCCSHPSPGEDVRRAAAIRLEYEMGIRADLAHRDSFLYRASVGDGLTEHEFDHLFTGISDARPWPEPREVMAYRYAGMDEILSDMDMNAEQYCAWFRIIFTRYYNRLKVWAK